MVSAVKKPSRPQHPVNTAGADRDYIDIEHQVGQLAVALHGMWQRKGHTGLTLPWQQPKRSGNRGMVLVTFDKTIRVQPIVIAQI
jgi:hypothetical protein